MAKSRETSKGSHQNGADLKHGQTGLRGGRVVQANRALVNFQRGLPLKAQGKFFCQRLGESREIFETLLARLSATDQAKEAVTARTGLSHEFKGQPSHGVSRVDFDDRLQPRLPIDAAINKGVDAEGSVKASVIQFSFEKGKDERVQFSKPARKS